MSDAELNAQVVYERQVGGDIRHGPSEFVQVGVRFDNRVLWLGSTFYPGDAKDQQYARDVDLAQEIVRRWNRKL